MVYDLRGYTIFDVIRNNVGSPASTFQFSLFNNSPGSLCDTILINNLGSNNVFLALSGTATTVGGSTMMLIPANATRSLDIKINSLSVAVSGGNYSNEIELVGLGI